MAVNAGLKNAKTLLLLKPFSVSRLPRPYHRKTTDKAVEEQRRTEETGSCWMPDPRTGIYFPRGQESVMDDIPSDAASFDCTFWLRSTDGVDHHKPDNHDFPSLTKF
ncbi:glutamate racemase [Perilla frutescens var. frutescens]|nr:glutamate racemase [Perilla frutescens var. frutescens]